MNKLVIFDLDGVLIDSKEIHYQALNNALRKFNPLYIIEREEHLKYYDGLTTQTKLDLLTERKNLPKTLHSQVWELKQHLTFEAFSSLQIDIKLIGICKWLKSQGFKVAVATNSIRQTTKIILLRLGIMEYVDIFVTNQDVSRPKPHPEMYWKCMTLTDCIPKNTLIVEDSPVGREGARNSGAHVCEVNDTNDVTLERIIYSLAKNNNVEAKEPWVDETLNVLIPMAGLGSRFSTAGYSFPKPLIDVRGKPMIQVVVDNLNVKAKFIYIVQREHYDKYNLKYLFNMITPNNQVIFVDKVTDGAARTTLLARDLIDSNNPLLIANSDQYVEWSSKEVLYAALTDRVDAGMLTFKSTHPKWSYAKVGENGIVERVAEKEVISDDATCGIYYWKHGCDYVKYAEQMISKNIRVNNEFYVCPVFNEAIADGKRVKIFPIDNMWGLGTPEDLNFFLANHK
jgi:HAD superfamily hydrolase (TIGR01509 family)